MKGFGEKYVREYTDCQLALSELKRETSNSNYTISQAVIVKRESGKLEIQDGFNADASMGEDTWTGSLLGSLVGVLGGPLGVLLGGSVGMMIGGAVDASDAAKNASLIEKAGDCIETALTAKLNRFDVTITRMNAAEVAAEVEHAREVERQMARDAREKMRAEKTETFKAGVAKKSEELKEWFANLGKNGKGE